MDDNGNSVLAFVPGKREIEKTIEDLSNSGLKARFFALHGDMTFTDQQKAFHIYNDGIPKVVVSTNVAQTSLTIPDINVVVDTGLERRHEYIDGLYTLTLDTITKSDVVQRSGRAGRTGPGKYYWCNDMPFNSLKEFPAPEIHTGSIDQIVLRLASVGINCDQLEFFHEVPTEKI